ncbi:hypothetical protein [Flavobacterium sp. UBA4197]|uniref:hypothetical protein n=1 Tax=Flavobacterium sp. UBA4197 TaxID=1946546 RepID=UPI00257E5171|nr:hypothetical protein [Flavobacterium sp. UBA4197]
MATRKVKPSGAMTKHLSIHDELKYEKKQAATILEKAKKIESQKIASGAKFIRVNAHTIKLIS